MPRESTKASASRVSNRNISIRKHLSTRLLSQLEYSSLVTFNVSYKRAIVTSTILNLFIYGRCEFTHRLLMRPTSYSLIIEQAACDGDSHVQKYGNTRDFPLHDQQFWGLVFAFEQSQ
jgi:hypothetical protein